MFTTVRSRLPGALGLPSGNRLFLNRMAGGNDRPTIRPPQYPELAKERSRKALRRPYGAAGKKASVAAETELESPPQAAPVEEHRTRKESPDRAAKFIHERGARNPRSGSYSLSGSAVSRDRIPAAISQAATDSDSSRTGIGGARTSTATQPPSDTSELRKRSSNPRQVPAVFAPSKNRPVSARRSYHSGGFTAASTPAPKSTRPRAQSPPATDAAAPDRRRVSSTNERDYVDPQRSKSSTYRSAVRPPADSAAPHRRKSSAQIPAPSPLSAADVGEDSQGCLGQIKDALRHIAHKRYELAIWALEDALRFEPDNEEAERWLLVCRARKLMAEGEREAAVRMYRRLIEKDLDNDEAAREIGDYEKEQALRAASLGRLFAKVPDPDAGPSKPRKRKKSNR